MTPVTIVSFDTRGNAPAIAGARWQDDSHIIFIGGSGDGDRQVYRVNTDSRRLERWTEHPTEILAFAIAEDAVFYAARPPQANDASAARVIPVRDQTPLQLLTSQEPRHSGVEYFVRRNGGAARKVYAQPGPLYPSSLHVWLSPNGRQAIVLCRPDRIPNTWGEYAQIAPEAGLPVAVGATQPSIQTLQYVLVDLEHASAVPLVDAPTGWSIQSYHEFDVVWANDRSVILLNTLVPARTQRNWGPSQHMRAWIVEVDTVTKGITPVVPLSNPQLGSAGTGGVVGLEWHGSANRLEVKRVGRNGPISSLWFTRAPGSWRPRGERSSLTVEFPRVTVVQSLNSPPELALQTDSSAVSERITNLNPQFEDVILTEVEVFRWTDSSGREWKGGLVLPSREPAERLPLVIQTHGFDERGFLADGAGALMDGAETSVFAARALAARGMVVLQVEDNPHVRDGALEAPSYLDGYQSAIRVLSAANRIDSSRVGIVGFSATSYHVKYALAFSQLFSAAVVADGIDMGYMQYFLVANSRNAADIHPLFERANGGRPFGVGLTAWQRKSPGFNLEGIMAPIRIEAYGPSSILSEWEFYAGLTSLGRPVEFFYYPNGSHTLVNPYDRLSSQTGTVDWFDFWLNGHEDSDPAKAEQYARWRAMREQRDENHRGSQVSLDQAE